MESRLCGFRDRDDGLFHADVALERHHRKTTQRHRGLLQSDDSHQPDLRRWRWRFGGESVFSEEQIAQTGTGGSEVKPTEEHQARGQTGTDSNEKEAESAKLQEVAKSIDKALMGISGESMVSEQLARHIVTRVTDEGLIVEFFDIENDPLFERDTATATPLMIEITAMISRVFGVVANDVAINGHMRAYPDMLKKNPVWDLSAARAQAVRELFSDAGFDAKRIERVSGFADRKPVAANPMALRNNRIEIILLRSDRPKD